MRCLSCYQSNIEINTENCPNCGIHLPSLLRDTLPCGTFIYNNKYQIEYPLAQGGFGITYQAVNTILNQKVAIKEYYPQSQVIREGKTGRIITPTEQSAAYSRGKQRFLREAQILAKFKHPHIVQVIDFFEERNTGYLVMELIEGHTLKDELKAHPQNRLNDRRVKEVMDTLIVCLTALHHQEIYHLDLKPENIMITKEGQIMLVDFGSARHSIMGDFTRRSASYTLQYAPPELLSGEDISAASDIFELGMMLCELLSGELPPDALKRLFNNQWNSDFLGEPWGTLVEEAIRLNPQERPQNVQSWWEKSSRKNNAQKIDWTIPEKVQKPIEIWETNFNIIQINEEGRGQIINEEPVNAKYYLENISYGTDLEMILIPDGEFLMGTPETEDGHDEDESPQHLVRINSFAMSKYPITQAQWELIMGNNPARFLGNYRPIECISWYDAQEFCHRLSKLTGRKYGLPTEAQWEYACRGGRQTAFSSGNYISTNFANFNSTYSYTNPPSNDYRQSTTDVDNFMPNPFGLYDMHGNIWEWCEDVWHDSYDGAPTDGTAWITGGNPALRVIRGGSWLYFSKCCRSGSRNWYFIDRQIDYVGFRVVCDLN